MPGDSCWKRRLTLNLPPDAPSAGKKVVAKGRRSMTFAELGEQSQVTEIAGLGSMIAKDFGQEMSGDGKVSPRRVAVWGPGCRGRGRLRPAW
jgi:hypothetical protein